MDTLARSLVGLCAVQLVCVVLAGCFDVPVLTARDVGPRDAPPRHTPRPLGVVAVRVHDAAGRGWAPQAIPRTPRVEIELTEPMVEDLEAVLVLRGPADDALREDLSRRPLTVATRERLVPIEVRWEGVQVWLTPHESFRAGEPVTVAVAGFALALEGEPLGAPSLTSMRVSDDASAGARVVAAFPADGTNDVPPNAEPFVLALDGDVVVTGEPVVVRGPAGALSVVTTIARCEPLGFVSTACLRVAPAGSLPRGVMLSIDTTSELRDATGASVPRHGLTVTTALDDDVRPPMWVAPSSCPIDAAPTSFGCVLQTDWSVRIAIDVDEPVRVELARSGDVVRTLAPRGSVVASLEGLLPSTAEDVTLSLIDLAGLRTEIDFELATRQELAPLTITEVCADPAGPEPRQEWIELANVGDAAASLAGTTISDREDELGAPIPSARVLVPGARVLLVGEGFDADAAGVPAGTALVVVGRTIVAAGLTNTGEPLFLRDAEGRRLSHVPAIRGREGECVVRDLDAHARADAIDDFHYDACTPGR